MNNETVIASVAKQSFKPAGLKDCFVALLLAMTMMTPAFAQDAPVPSQHPAAELAQRKADSEAKKKDLEVQADKASADLKTTQDELVSLAVKVKENEMRLNALDKRMTANKTEQDQIEKRLKKDKGSIGDLVLALERLDRTPPEAILARPGAPLETAQSAMLLQSILPNIYGRAESLKKDLARLDVILKQLQSDKQEAQDTAAQLAKRQTEMAALLKKRKNLYASTQSGIAEQEAALREISKQADDLKDLVARLEERERTARQQETTHLASATTSGEEPSRASFGHATPLPRAGQPQLPISGTIRIGFGQTDDIGAQSQGLTIEGRDKSLVVAPMGGIVRYTGTFKNYGQIIIVEHQKEYHSLIAGLARIDTVVGQSVAAGEPVGILGKSTGDGDKPTLYYELRYQGQPVNPSRKFAGL